MPQPQDVWVFKGPDYVAVTHERFIEPSVKLTYSKMNVVITKTFDGLNTKTFEVRKPAKIGESIGELITTLEFRLHQVYDEVTHL